MKKFRIILTDLETGVVLNEEGVWKLKGETHSESEFSDIEDAIKFARYLTGRYVYSEAIIMDLDTKEFIERFHDEKASKIFFEEKRQYFEWKKSLIRRFFQRPPEGKHYKPEKTKIAKSE